MTRKGPQTAAKADIVLPVSETFDPFARSPLENQKSRVNFKVPGRSSSRSTARTKLAKFSARYRQASSLNGDKYDGCVIQPLETVRQRPVRAQVTNACGLTLVFAPII